jgi:hypothetical protein
VVGDANLEGATTVELVRHEGGEAIFVKTDVTDVIIVRSTAPARR